MINKNKLIFLLIVISTLLTIFLVFNYLARKQMVCWDEGNSIYVGNTVSQALKKGNYKEFWQLSFNQLSYPFLQSWYLAFTTLPFAYTIETARLASLFLLLPTVILVWLIAKILTKNNSLATLATLLLLTSPYSLVLFSMAMREGLGITLTLLTVWLYLSARQKKPLYWFFLGGLSLLLLMLTKYNLGGIVIITLGLESGLWFLTEKAYQKKKFSDYFLKNLFLYLPLVLGLFFWLKFPVDRFNLFLSVIQQYSAPLPKDIFNLKETSMFGHLIFYPQELAFCYSFSWLLALFLAIGFLYALKDGRKYQIRTPAVFFLVGLILTTRNYMNNQGRYLFTIVPLFFLVGGYGLLELWPRIKKIKLSPFVKGLLIPLGGLIIFLLTKDLLTFPRYLTGLASKEVISAVFYEQDFQKISIFDFDRDHWPKIPPPADHEKINDALDFIALNVDLRKSVNFAGFLNEFSPGLTFFYLDQVRAKPITNFPKTDFQEHVVAIMVKDGTRFDTYAYRIFSGLGPLYAAQQVLADRSLTKITQKYFPYLGLTVTILGR